MAANLTVPWQTLADAGRVLAALGVVGTLYILNALRHARRQAGYKPDAEDWFWYVVLPLFLYLALVVVGAELQAHPERSLFTIAAVTVALLGAGIHNAWDTVTYVALAHPRSGTREQGKSAPGQSGRS